MPQKPKANMGVVAQSLVGPLGPQSAQVSKTAKARRNKAKRMAKTIPIPSNICWPLGFVSSIFLTAQTFLPARFEFGLFPLMNPVIQVEGLGKLQVPRRIRATALEDQF